MLSNHLQVSGLLFCSWARGINYIQCSDYVSMTFCSTFVVTLVFILWMEWLPNGFNLLKAFDEDNEPVKITSFTFFSNRKLHVFSSPCFSSNSSKDRNQIGPNWGANSHVDAINNSIDLTYEPTAYWITYAESFIWACNELTTGCFPFDQKFRDFRSETEWNGQSSGKSFGKFRNTFWVHPL